MCLHSGRGVRGMGWWLLRTVCVCAQSNNGSTCSMVNTGTVLCFEKATRRSSCEVQAQDFTGATFFTAPCNRTPSLESLDRIHSYIGYSPPPSPYPSWSFRYSLQPWRCWRGSSGSRLSRRRVSRPLTVEVCARITTVTSSEAQHCLLLDSSVSVVGGSAVDEQNTADCAWT